MKKILLSIITLLILLSANAQSWTNFTDGYKSQYTLAITDSLIFIGGSGVINVYTPEGEYRYTKFTNEDIYSSVIDSEGNIWFSSGSNILKFDGNEWSNYRPEIGEEYSCTSVACDKNNNLWATFSYNADSGYISKFDGTSWKNISSFGDTTSINLANEIVIDTNNVVYVGISVSGNDWYYGIVRIANTDTSIFHYQNSNCMVGPRLSSYLDKNNHVWYGGPDNALARYDGTEWHMEGEYPEFNNKSFSAIYQDIDENKWLGTTSGLFIENETTWTEYTAEDELYFDYIFDIKSNSNNDIWLVCNSIDYDGGCLTKYNQTNFTHYYPNTFKGIPEKVVFRNNEIWTKTNSGICVYVDGSWKTNDIEGIIAYNDIRDITKDANNNIWIATANRLYRIDESNSIEEFTNILGHELSVNRCLSTYQNTVWLNSSTLLFKFDGENWSEIDLTNAPSDYFYDIEPINSDEFWVGTQNGSAYYDGNYWTSYNEESGLANNLVNDISIEGNKIWFATIRGLTLYDGNEWVTYEHDSVSFVAYNNNTSIHIDKKGHKWVGCSKGIYRYDNYNFHFTQPNSIDESISYITEDSEGNVWVAGQHGLSKYTFAPDNIEDFITNDQTFEIYPNPTTDNFNINLPYIKETDMLKIYSITGKCILSQKVKAGENNIEIDDISSGIYIVRLEKSQKYSKLIIE